MFLGMVLGSFSAVVGRMRGMAVGGMRMMRRVLVIACVVVPSSFVMMVGRTFVVLGCRSVVFSAFVLAICKAMLATNIYPDFIVIDGKEGGTGAAPLEFMFTLGCIQSQSCHTDRCPTGVATQDRARQRALVVPDKLQRVANLHGATMQSLIELTAAAGLDHPSEFAPEHFSRRVSPSEVMTFRQLYPPLAPGELLRGTRDLRFREAWELASISSFRPSQVTDVAMRRQA